VTNLLRLGPFQQITIVLGVWLGALVAPGADVNAATNPITLVSVLTFAFLLHMTTSR
jgi:hypothetical protein